MKNKKGLSDVIATVLIILLALAAIAIVWGFLQPVFTNTGGAIDGGAKCLEAEVKPLSCNSTTKQVTVQWLKGDVAEIVAIVEDGSGGTTINQTASKGLLATTTHTFATITAEDKARAAAVVLDDQGNLFTCSESPTGITCVA